MPGTEESLFSLELVVEKIYLPHVICRFPAVAFRLLDFPTIVINHVEAELGKAIRRQISFDPDYELPEQFCELKDKHGNFIIKKGKSCLFKMIADTLKNHLASTPLYVMVIDMFPETPKLVGNSTVPLNILIEAICADMVRLGPTVPSVHGDKGLFKIYNLMGKEIGYFVLGFRLLCLGPSLIPHLPEAALVQRQSKRQKAKENRENNQMVKMVQLSQGDEKQEDDEEEDLVETRTWGSMTDPIKQDVMMQTVEMNNKGIHVDIQTPAVASVAAIAQPQLATASKPDRNICNSGTQTDKKGIKAAFNAKKKVMEDLAALEEIEDIDEVIVTNIVCPPPLFFNCDAKPKVEVENDSYSLDTDMSVSDDVSLESFTDEELDNESRIVSKPKPHHDEELIFFDRGQIMPPPAPISYENIPMNVRFAEAPQQRTTKHTQAQNQFLSAQSPVGTFPLLSALMNELLCIQNPDILQGLHAQQQPPPNPKYTSASTRKQISTPSPGPVKSTTQKNFEMTNIVSDEKENLDEKDIYDMSRKGHRKCAHPHTGVPKDKSWLRVIPEYGTGKKKSKLMFGLTNTQRLRLQKTNPAWLRSMERKEAANKGGRIDITKRHDSGDELNISHYSDTLTEVRRQAQKELEKTAANDTLTSAANASLLSTPKPPKSRWKSPKKQRSSAGTRQRGPPSPKPRSPKTPVSGQGRRYSVDSNEPVSHRPHSVDSSVKNIMSPDPGAIVPSIATGDLDEAPTSARSVDQPSSARSRSIEVRMPSMSQDEGSEATITDSEDDDVPLPDESFGQNGNKRGPANFPSYLKQSESLPESIDGRPNQSLNTTTGLDENSPMESTRNYHPDVGDSRNMQSTDDFDTKQTFHSTSEPELQELVSDEEREKANFVGTRQFATSSKFPVINPMMSEKSPVPSTRHSVANLELSRSNMPVTPRADTITPRSSRSGSPKRPTPRPRRPLRDWKESIHTDSLSSYMPSDPENVQASFSSGEGNYSDDFFEESGTGDISDKPRLIPSTKLGYTIH